MARLVPSLASRHTGGSSPPAGRQESGRPGARLGPVRRPGSSRPTSQPIRCSPFIRVGTSSTAGFPTGAMRAQGLDPAGCTSCATARRPSRSTAQTPPERWSGTTSWPSSIGTCSGRSGPTGPTETRAGTPIRSTPTSIWPGPTLRSPSGCGPIPIGPGPARGAGPDARQPADANAQGIRQYRAGPIRGAW